jgi:hypothetical protein
MGRPDKNNYRITVPYLMMVTSGGPPFASSSEHRVLWDGVEGPNDDILREVANGTINTEGFNVLRYLGEELLYEKPGNTPHPTISWAEFYENHLSVQKRLRFRRWRQIRTVSKTALTKLVSNPEEEPQSVTTEPALV